MRVYHVTRTALKGKIMREGIDPRYSKGARKECWFVTPGNLSWACLHVMQRHGLKLGEVTAFEVLVPGPKLTRRRRGIYTCYEVVKPLFVVEAVEAEGVALAYPCEVPHFMMKGG
jgi:hypothetical protein